MAKKNFGGIGRTLKQYPVLVLFFVLLFGMFAVDLAVPDKARSEVENTSLKQRPTLNLAGKTSIGAVIDAADAYLENYGEYVKAQVAGRDGWISLQAGVETVVLRKTQSGGMLLGADGRMYARDYSLTDTEKTRLPLNTGAVAKLASRWPGKVTVMLVPSASTVYADDVPAGAPLIDENAMLDDAFAAFAAAGAATLDLRGTFAQHSGEYLYYNTDHHWTTLGAYYAYLDYCAAQGLTPFDRSAYEAVEVTGFLGTSWAKARTPFAAQDTITYYQLENPMQIYRVMAGASSATSANLQPDGQPVGLYNAEQWSQYDKYAAFLHGNNGFSIIQGNGTGKVLVIKDSYANSFVPYLTANYAEIHVVDFRNFASGLDGIIAEYDYDQVLVLYSFASFRGDIYLSRAGVAG